MLLRNGGVVRYHSPEFSQVFIFKSLFLLQLTGFIFPALNFPKIFYQVFHLADIDSADGCEYQAKVVGGANLRCNPHLQLTTRVVFALLISLQSLNWCRSFEHVGQLQYVPPSLNPTLKQISPVYT